MEQNPRVERLSGMRSVAVLVLIMLVAAGCIGQSSSSGHSHWYQIGYSRCSKVFSRDQTKTGQKQALRLLRLPKGVQTHQAEFRAGCAAAAKKAGAAPPS